MRFVAVLRPLPAGCSASPCARRAARPRRSSCRGPARAVGIDVDRRDPGLRAPLEQVPGFAPGAPRRQSTRPRRARVQQGRASCARRPVPTRRPRRSRADGSRRPAGPARARGHAVDDRAGQAGLCEGGEIARRGAAQAVDAQRHRRPPVGRVQYRRPVVGQAACRRTTSQAGGRALPPVRRGADSSAARSARRRPARR